MTSASGPARPPETADTAEGLPAAFAKDGAPYSLEELLSGLPPIEDDGALLLSELAPSPQTPASDWTGETALPEQPTPRETPTEELRQAEGSAAISAIADMADSEPLPTEEEEDVLLLTEEVAPERTEPEGGDETTVALNAIAAALRALADETPPVEEEDVLVLGEEFQPRPEVPTAGREDDARWEARIEEIIAAHLPAGMIPEQKGDGTLPRHLDALALLLSDPPPADDFAALDALYACWPRTTQDSPSRALLAAAQNLSRNFGLPEKLPMASAKAWRMLSPRLFEAELAQRLTAVGQFIADWQKTQRTFLILEFSEVELIEYLFEALHPGHHAQLLAEVMNFKVLSGRRMGLLRRIPGRMRKIVAPMLPDDKERALVELAHAKALLELVASTSGFTPIIDTAAKALEEIGKLAKAAANAGAPQLPPGAPPGALGRIG